MHWFAYAILLLLCLGGIFITLLGLPGLWVMVAAALVYAWYTSFNYVGLWTLVILAVIAAIAELIEFLAGSAGAKKAGGSRRAAWGALIGGLLGAFLLTIPIPIVGTTIGLCIGVFVGALIGELTVRDDAVHSIRVGIAATKARLYAIIIKLLFSVAMLAIAAIKAVPFTRT
ncbi:MAG TPA: DUF456 domain-containing protein [Tepidisphaeraceae bacterium]|jgi:hypothetical protein|nr:DUF456 domain-containing protein [Tepidisphaeraceae bacterium]